MLISGQGSSCRCACLSCTSSIVHHLNKKKMIVTIIHIKKVKIRNHVFPYFQIPRWWSVCPSEKDKKKRCKTWTQSCYMAAYLWWIWVNVDSHVVMIGHIAPGRLLLAAINLGTQSQDFIAFLLIADGQLLGKPEIEHINIYPYSCIRLLSYLFKKN